MDSMQAQIPELMMPHFKDLGFNIWHEGHEAGLEKGIAEGLEKGLEKGKEVNDIGKKLEFVVNLFCDAPTLTDAARAGLASVDLAFVTRVRKTFTRRSIKNRRAQFREFYQQVTGMVDKDYVEVEQLFERLSKKIKSSKHKLMAKEKKKKGGK